MRPGNLLALKIVKCLACYDYGVIVDRFDQDKRSPCECGAKKEPPRPRRLLSDLLSTTLDNHPDPPSA
jgi:hypothetical protein